MADNDSPETPAPAAPKPARRRSTTPAKAAAAKTGATPKTKAAGESVPTPAKSKPKAAPKPRSTKRAAPPPSTTRRAVNRTRSVAKTAGEAVSHAPDKVGGGWGAAAIGAGVAALGAVAAAAVLAQRQKVTAAEPVGSRAHQADGADVSRSFQAGIADEGSIPE